MSRLFGRVLDGLRGPGSARGYERAKSLVEAGAAGERRRVAAARGTAPEILYYLAADPAPEVRRAVAENGATPPQADLLLARDRDDRVRCDLAHKVGRLAPGLDARERDRARAAIIETLEMLARDALPEVRRILAEELKRAEGVPAQLVERLARDDDPDVAAPVLEFSPLLTEDFLVELIATVTSGAGAKLAAVARRESLGAAAADAIVARDDEAAIACLLRNESAQIREATLDALCDRAEGVPAWHGPLVARPLLSPRAMRRLATFVGESLVESLARRADLDPATAELLRAALRRRIGEDRAGADSGAFADDATLVARARKMAADGELGATAVLRAVAAGERPFAMAALAVLSDLPLAAVQKIVSLKSAKGLVALAWKAGLAAEQAAQLQLRLARIAPSSVLGVRGDGGWPLSEADMRWQLDYFAGSA